MSDLFIICDLLYVHARLPWTIDWSFGSKDDASAYWRVTQLMYLTVANQDSSVDKFEQ